jgi:hypothetical protein
VYWPWSWAASAEYIDPDGVAIPRLYWPALPYRATWGGVPVERYGLRPNDPTFPHDEVCACDQFA